MASNRLGRSVSTGRPFFYVVIVAIDFKTSTSNSQQIFYLNIWKLKDLVSYKLKAEEQSFSFFPREEYKRTNP